MIVLITEPKAPTCSGCPGAAVKEIVVGNTSIRFCRVCWDSLKSQVHPKRYDAGYRDAKEDAATIAEHPYRLGEVDGQTKPTEVGEAVAAEIRKLEPKP